VLLRLSYSLIIISIITMPVAATLESRLRVTEDLPNRGPPSRPRRECYMLDITEFDILVLAGLYNSDAAFLCVFPNYSGFRYAARSKAVASPPKARVARAAAVNSGRFICPRKSSLMRIRGPANVIAPTRAALGPNTGADNPAVSGSRSPSDTKW
jgi:hypothetical protein